MILHHIATHVFRILIVNCFRLGSFRFVVTQQYGYDEPSCSIPFQLHGEWYSKETGDDILTTINRDSMRAHVRLCEI